TERPVLQGLEQATALLGELSGQLGRRRGSGDVVQARSMRRIIGPRSFVAHLGAAALDSPLVAYQSCRLAFRNDQQQPPEVVAVAQVREAALPRAAAEAVQGA